MMTFCVTIILMSGGGKTDKKNHRNCSTGRYGKTSFVQPMEKGTKFVCKDLGMGSMNIPHFNVIFSVDVVETKIKTINACAEIKKKSTNKWIFRMMLLWLVVDDMMVGEHFYWVMRNGKTPVFE